MVNTIPTRIYTPSNIKDVTYNIPVRITTRHNTLQRKFPGQTQHVYKSIPYNCIPTPIPPSTLRQEVNPLRNTVTNHRALRKVPYRKSYNIPTVLSANVRGIAKKVDEIQQVAELNNVNAICITETWLSPNVPDSSVVIPGYNLFRKDRVNTTGGGVRIYLNNTIPFKRLEQCNEEGVESVWISMRLYCLPRNITP